MRQILSPSMLEKLHGRFQRLYGDDAEFCLRRLKMLLGRYGVGDHPLGMSPMQQHERWNEKDVILITYGNSVHQPGQHPLATLSRFLVEHLQNAISTVHILPFFPYSSDDGFSVIDYRKVNPELGTWSAIHSIGRHFDLMFDLVLNHVSAQSKWFRDYVSAIAPGRRYFIEVDPSTDLSRVVRPRNLPLLKHVRTRDGERHVWTTFSEDQIDLNFANPDVLFEFLDILLIYISHGVRIIRLDAIAYLWKKIGTPCIHLAETHEVVKIFRDVLELVAPGIILLTETNVPHEENIRYFGDGDEAHVVYQFSLPPLLLHALYTGKVNYLRHWVQALGEPPRGCTYLNFTASHDGIGVRPLEGLIPDSEMASLLQKVRERGGHISTKGNSDGSESPYELNITYFDALSDPGKWGSPLHQRRFICSQTVALQLKGIPALYIHSLTATRNDYEGVERLGHPRAINRKSWDGEELNALLSDPASAVSRVFNRYVQRLQIRRAHPAFHPDGRQDALDFGDRLFAVRRISPDESETILCVNNLSPRAQQFTVTEHNLPGCEKEPLVDLLRKRREIGDDRKVNLRPYESCWIRVKPS